MGRKANAVFEELEGFGVLSRGEFVGADFEEEVRVAGREFESLLEGGGGFGGMAGFLEQEALELDGGGECRMLIEDAEDERHGSLLVTVLGEIEGLLELLHGGRAGGVGLVLRLGMEWGRQESCENQEAG